MARNRDASCVHGARVVQELRHGFTDARCSEDSNLGQPQALADVGKRITDVVDLTFAGHRDERQIQNHIHCSC